MAAKSSEVSENEFTLEKRYSVVCPGCQAEITAAPSWAMQSGFNMGRGYHAECGTGFLLHLVPGTWGEAVSEQPTGMAATMEPDSRGEASDGS